MQWYIVNIHALRMENGIVDNLLTLSTYLNNSIEIV